MAHVDGTAGRSTPTVLVADDEQIMRQLMRLLLEEHGCRVIEAATAAEAISLVEECDGAVDVLIADVMMPEMTGREAVAQIHARYPKVAVVYVTGCDTETAVASGAVGAADKVLQKPFETGEFVQTVMSLLEGTSTE